MREKQKTATAKQISAMYGIPTGTLANLRCQKRGPRYYKIGCGRKVLYALSDVEDWIMRNPVLTSESLAEDDK